MLYAGGRYAYEATGGRLVTEMNLHLIPEVDLVDWDAAIAEYDDTRRHRPE